MSTQRIKGRALSKTNFTEADQARFWSKVDVRGKDDCWAWKGATNTNGYGRFQMRRPLLSVMANRVSFVLSKQDIPAGMLVCHSCDNPVCCNPSHLWLGTEKDNTHDSVQKRRHSMLVKTHCPQGHPYDEQNTVINKAGSRQCRACFNERRRIRWAKDHALQSENERLKDGNAQLAALVEEWRRTLQTIRHCGYSELVVTHDTMGSAPHKVGLWADAALALTTAEALARQREKEKAT